MLARGLLNRIRAKPMKFFHTAQVLTAGIAVIHLASCSGVQVTHVKPGQSARAHLAELERAKQAPAAVPPIPDAAVAGAPQLPPEMLPPLPSGQVNIPAEGGSGGALADSFSRGTFAMQAGQTTEAISAFEETVKLDPDFTDAWGKLAILYQKNGETAKALEAYKKAKRQGDANGGTVTRDTVGGLQLQ